MKISTRSRYGLRLMVFLGMQSGKGPVYLKDIARQEEISEKYLSQIIIPLRVAGLVTSFRGAQGGYILSVPPQRITVRQIVEALEGTLSLIDCVEEKRACPRQAQCVTQQVWIDLAQEMIAYLDKITVAALIERARIHAGEEVTYHI